MNRCSSALARDQSAGCPADDHLRLSAELTEALRDEGLKQQVLARSVNDCQEVQDDFFRRQSAGRFPVLSREVNGLPLAYLDSAAVRRNQAR